MKNSFFSIPNSDIEIYFKCLCTLASTDSHFHEKEFEYVKMQAVLYGYDIDSALEGNHDLCSVKIDTLCWVSKISILRDLIILAYCDGDYSREEQKKIEEIASLMTIPFEKIEEIHKWLIDYWELLGRLAIVFAEDD